MDNQSLYTLQLKSLSVGEHIFHYTLDNAFFRSIEESEISVGQVEVEVRVEKTNLNANLTFFLDGEIEIPCDRCLDPMEQPIEQEEHLVVKFGESYSEESDELIIIPEREGTLNIAWLLYEFVALAIPITHYHEDGECNEEMMRTYQKLTVQAINTDDEDTVEKENDKVDPRWAALKNIIDNN